MLRNYLLVSLRNIKRHFTYSFINILGLVLGLASVIVISLWVHREYSFDDHYKNSENIYRIGVNFYNVGAMAVGPYALAEELRQYPSVAQTTWIRIAARAPELKINGESVIYEEVYSTSPTYFEVFDYPVIHGSLENTYQGKNAAVITRESAIQLFKEENPVGSTFDYGDNTYEVVAVVEHEGPSHISPKVFLSDSESKSLNWFSAQAYIYAALTSGNSASDMDMILDDLMATKILSALQKEMPVEEVRSENLYNFYPLLIEDIHLESTLKFEPGELGDKKKTNAFAGIAVLILILACVNYINISTARATIRAKEVGIRKTFGTTRWQLIKQFTLESILVFSISAFIGLVLGEYFLDLFERFTGMKLLDRVVDGYEIALIIIFSGILMGALTGLYPAYYISRFSTMKVLKGNILSSEKGIFRNTLVLVQFVISIGMIIGAIVVYQQMNFMKNSDVGINRENVLVINAGADIEGNRAFFRDQLLALPYVGTVSFNQRVPSSRGVMVSGLTDSTSQKQFFLQSFAGDDQMFDALGYRLVEGRLLSEDLTTDTASLLLNESAVAEIGLKNPIGARLGDFRVVGVVADFNYETMAKKIESSMIYLDPKGTHLVVRYTGNNEEELLAKSESLWAGVNSAQPMDYYFLDESYKRLAEKEETLSRGLLIFTLLAIIISCLGLYGLSAFIAERKVKEIGIRRVLGATVTQISLLLSRKFALPILLAFVIASPLTYFLIDAWLSNYAYRVEVAYSWWIMGGAAAMLIGLSTVSWQSIKSALRNPVDSLRDE